MKKLAFISILSENFVNDSSKSFLLQINSLLLKGLRVILLLMFIFNSLISNCQETILKAGMNLSNMYVESDGEIIDSKVIVGSNFGIASELQIYNKWYFETGILFSANGFKYNTNSAYWGDSDYKFKLSYLNIPLLAKYKYSINDLIIFGNAGPYVGYALSGKLFEDGYGEKVDWDDEYDRIDLGLLIGAGLEVKDFLFGINYGYGLYNISNEDDIIFKNNTLSFSLGYRL